MLKIKGIVVTLITVTIIMFFMSIGLASATPVLYDGGPSDFRTLGRNISNNVGATESFSLKTDSVITGANFLAWTGYTTPLTTNWAITTVPFSVTTIASGTSSISYIKEDLAAIICSNIDYAYPSLIFSSGIAFFSLPSIFLSSGTYYFQLYNAISSPDIGAGEFVNWGNDIGPSQAVFDFLGTDLTISFASSFQIIGTPVPEPGMLLMLGAGLAGLVLISKRLKR